MSRVGYELDQDNGIVTLTMDDGKANSISFEMLQDIHAALDRAIADQATAIILTGKKGLFSAGFHLGTLMKGDARSLDLLKQGFQLAERLFGLPIPVVTASHGHAVAMGLFILLCGDVTVGADTQSSKIVANEVQIGIKVPRPAIDLLRYRLSPAAFNLAATTSHLFDPEAARTVGIYDLVVPEQHVLTSAREQALRLSQLNAEAFAQTKALVRKHVLRQVHGSIQQEDEELRARL